MLIFFLCPAFIFTFLFLFSNPIYIYVDLYLRYPIFALTYIYVDLYLRCPISALTYICVDRYLRWPISALTYICVDLYLRWPTYTLTYICVGLAAARDGRLLVGGGRSRFLHVWALETRSLLRVLDLYMRWLGPGTVACWWVEAEAGSCMSGRWRPGPCCES